MKNTAIIILALVSIMLSACEEDNPKPDDTPDNFAEIMRDHIVAKEATFSNTTINGTIASGHLLNVGDIFLYKTNNNLYGKLQILAIDDANNYKLTIKAVTYNSDGIVFSESPSLNIRGTWMCDLDAMIEATSTNCDFQWDRATSTNTNFNPLNGALFVKYVLQ